MDEEIYKENILDHYRNPHNKDALDEYDLRGGGTNPTCGDELELFIKLDNDSKVVRAAFLGSGCAISQAAASMLTDMINGKTLAELKLLAPGDIYSMLGIHVSPGRANCALLSYRALSEGLKHHE
ncbi:MAG: Fe-S cluster assembly sulfur transfer protein SufU [Minisyncoccota bacterium]